MKNQNWYFHFFLSLLFVASYSTTWATSKTQEPNILLEDRFEVNKNHPYFEAFKKVEEKLGIASIYYANLSCAGNTRQEKGGPLVANKRGKNSLIFTLQFEDRIEFDTLQNCVHVENNDGFIGSIRNWFTSWFEDDWAHDDVIHSIKGSLPSIVETTWVKQIERQRTTPMGIKLSEAAEVTIAIRKLDQELVKIVHQGTLPKGAHEFVWPHRDVSKGYY